MKYVVDARFENGIPRLRVLDAETGTVHLEWSLTRVNKMLEEGEIPPEDFLHPKRYGMNLLLKNLFLLSCIESINNDHLQKREASSNKIHIAPVESEKQSSHKNFKWHFGIKMNPV